MLIQKTKTWIKKNEGILKIILFIVAGIVLFGSGLFSGFTGSGSNKATRAKLSATENALYTSLEEVGRLRFITSDQSKSISKLESIKEKDKLTIRNLTTANIELGKLNNVEEQIIEQLIRDGEAIGKEYNFIRDILEAGTAEIDRILSGS